MSRKRSLEHGHRPRNLLSEMENEDANRKDANQKDPNRKKANQEGGADETVGAAEAYLEALVP